MKLHLASKSPRRIEMLTALGADILVCVADIDESAFAAQSPERLVCLLAKEKALAASKKVSDIDAPIVAADTVVDLDGVVLGKPKTKEQAKEMLQSLSGRGHMVHTGIAVLYRGKMLLDTVSTQVCFTELSEDEIDAYVNSGDPMDKAGSYGVQTAGGLFVKEIHGDYHAVVGLPICRLNEMLKESGAGGLL